MTERDATQISDNPPPRLASFLSVRFAAVVLLQTLLLILALAFVQARVVEKQALRDNASAATRLGEHVDNFLAHELRTLSQFASWLRAAPIADDQYTPLLNATLDSLDDAVTIIAINSDGNVLAGAPDLKNADGSSVWDAVNVADRAYFQKPMQSGGVFVSPLFRGRGYGRELLLAVSVAVPESQHRPGDVAVVEASLPLAVLTTHMKSLALTDGREYAVLSPGGVVASSSDGLQWPAFSIMPLSLTKQLEQLPAGRGSWISDHALGEQRWLVNSYPLRDDWRVVVMLPRNAHVQQMLTGLLWPGAASMSIGLILLLAVQIVARKLGREGDAYAGKIESLTPEALGDTPLPRRAPRVAFREAGRVYAAVTNLVARMRSTLEDQRAAARQLELLRASLQHQVEAQEGEIQSRTSMLLTSSSELRQSQQLLEDAQVTGRIGIWSWVPASAQLFLSSGAQRLLDTPPMRDHLPLDAVLASVVAEDRDRAHNAFEHCRLSNSSLAITFRVCDDRGRNAWLLMRGAHGRASGSSEWIFRGTILDITERYLAERRLTRFADSVEQLWHAAIGSTESGRIQEIVEAARCAAEASLAQVFISGVDREAVFTLDQHGNFVPVRRRDEYPAELFAADTGDRGDKVWQHVWRGENVLLARADGSRLAIGLLLSRLGAEAPGTSAMQALVGLAALLIANAEYADHRDEPLSDET
jgi:PAS domain-containing protein